MRKKRVSFSLSAPDAEVAFLAGDFNDWNPDSHPMKRDKKGIWKVSLGLPPGTYQYRFLVDGKWQNDPNCSDSVVNPFGTFNCLRRVE
jgi:5'-AMP-activated protein kinase regulatory beta subunit